MTTKFIFVTGGVVSSLGKGLAAASIGSLLEARGFRVTLQKMDPYINVDAGTMSPVPARRGLRHRRRRRDRPRPRPLRALHLGPDDPGQQRHHRARSTSPSSRRSAAGDYLGRTVQVIPHITDEIKASIRQGGRAASTSSSSRSAAPSATSRACPSSRPSASSRRTSARTTSSTSTSRWCRSSRPPPSSRPRPPSTR